MTPESGEGSRVIEDLIRRDRKGPGEEEQPKEHKEVLEELVISEEEALDHLVEYAQDFQFWVGSGFSASSGIPLAGEIAQEIAIKVYEKTNPDARGEVDFEDIEGWLTRRKWYNDDYAFASCLEKEYPSKLLRTKYFREMLEGRDPSPADYYLTIAVKHGAVNPLIWTTNFDDLLEKAFYNIRRTSAIIPDRVEEVDLIQEGDEDHNYVAKIYGDWEEYQPRYFREGGSNQLHPNVLELFDQRMRGKGLVTVGYSGTERPAMNMLKEHARSDEDHFEKGMLWGYYGELRDVPRSVTELVAEGDFNRKYFRIFEISDADLFMEKLARRLDIPRIEDELQLSFHYFNVMTYRGMKDRESWVYPTLDELGPDQLMDRGFFVEDFEEIFESEERGFLDRMFTDDEELELEKRDEHRKGLIHCYVHLMDENFETALERFRDVEERDFIEPDEDSSFGTGYALYRMGEFEAAIDRLEDACEFNEQAEEDAQIKQDKRRIRERRVGYHYLQAVCAQKLNEHEREIGYYDRALEITPGRADLWYNRGVAFSRLGQLQDEIDSYERSVEQQKTFYRSWYNLGIALSEDEAYLRAMKSFENASERAQELEEAFFNTGRLLGRMGQDTRALENFRSALELDDDDFDAIYNLGVALLNENRNEEARVAFETYLDENPEDLDSLNNLGLALHELELYGEALEQFDQYLELEDSHYRVWYNRGFTLVQLERFEEALEAYNKSLDINPDTDLVWYRKAALLSAMDRNEEARQFYERYLDLNEEDHRAWYEFGEVCGRLGDFATEIEAYERALDIQPTERHIHKHLGIALNNRAEQIREQESAETPGQGERHAKPFKDAENFEGGWEEFADKLNERAIEEFEEAERWELADAELYFEEGRAYDAIEQSLRANESYENAVEEDETHAESWLRRGINLARLEQFAKAIDCFDKTIEYKPDEDSAWRNKGLAYIHMKENDKAIETFDEAVQRFPENATLWRDLAYANAQVRNGDEVARALNKALDLDPSIKERVQQEEDFSRYLNHPELKSRFDE